MKLEIRILPYKINIIYTRKSIKENHHRSFNNFTQFFFFWISLLVSSNIEYYTKNGPCLKIEIFYRGTRVKIHSSYEGRSLDNCFQSDLNRLGSLDW